jgi:hypothetical protein
MKRARLIPALLLLLAAGLLAQRFRFGFRREQASAPTSFPTAGEFHFVRLEYTDLPYVHRGFGFGSRNGTGEGWWVVDWPDSDEHFTTGVQRLTRLQVGEPLHMRLEDDRIFDNPWIYATQTGYWDLSDAEIARLREYLLRGGFLVVDDFWDTEQWEVFRETMNRVFPNKPITDLTEADTMMNVLYNIRDKDRTWIPGTRHLYFSGGQVIVRQPAGTSPAWRALYDDRNRAVVAVNYNTDVGDAWEYADAPEYPEAMTTLAYHYGLNYLIYSMTH